MHRCTPFLLLTLSACKGCEDPTAEPVDLDPVSADAVGVRVDGATGDSARFVVFATNAVGAAVPAASVSLRADVPLASDTLVADAGGWGVVEVSGTGTLGVALTAGIGGGEATAVGLRTQRPLPVWGDAGAAGPGQARAVAWAGNGAAWATGREVWWAIPGGTAVRVLALPDTVTGIQAVAGDDDGVDDLLVWSPGSVTLLRGRDDGGLVFGAGWTPARGTVAGAYVGDVAGDGERDVAITLDLDGVGGRFVVMAGNGVWEFRQAEAADISTVAVAMTMDDLDGDGVLELTLLDESGVLRRWARLGDSWTPTTTGILYELGLGAGAHLYAPADFDGDGIPDIVAAGPLRDGSGWQAWVVTVGSDDPSMFRAYNGEGDRSAPSSLGVAVGDLTGDGLADLALSAPGAFTRGNWDTTDPENPAFRLVEYDALPEGALAARDLDYDDVLDLLVAGDGGVAVVTGERIPDVPGTTEDEGVAWRIATPASRRIEAGLADGIAIPARVGDVTGDRIADVVGFVRNSQGLAMATWVGVRSAGGSADEALRAGTPVLIGATSEPVDLAVCGSRVFAVVRELDGTTSVRRWGITSAGALAAQGGPFAVTGATAVACGSFAAGEAAILQSTGAVTYLATNGALTAGETLAGGADIAAVDTDGNGTDTPVACGPAGCTVLGLDVDGDGLDEVITGEDGVVIVTFASESLLLDASGEPSLGDADSDGILDLLVADAGRITVHRSAVGAGPGPAESSHARRPAGGAALVGDLSGDGRPDAFWFSETDGARDGGIVYARGAAE